jgi:alpha-L-rhamnosidase
MEMLSRAGLSSQILDESIATYLSMVEMTGTLWEYFKPKASCNHGFASHLTNVLYRDVLGVYKVLPCERKVQLRFIDSGLEWCKGSIPVGDESVDVEWSCKEGKFDVTLHLPDGYRYEVIPTSANIIIK